MGSKLRSKLMTTVLAVLAATAVAHAGGDPIPAIEHNAQIAAPVLTMEAEAPAKKVAVRKPAPKAKMTKASKQATRLAVRRNAVRKAS